jgi:hypothetical protein
VSPADIKAPPTPEQLYAMLGEALAENRVLKALIAQHPELFAANAVPEANGHAHDDPAPPDGAPEEG